MKECDYNHLILYAKGHYERTDRLEDVRKIMAHRTGNETVSDEDVWHCAVHALEEHCPDGLGRVMTDLFKPEWKKDYPMLWFAPQCSLSQALYHVLLELMKLKVSDGDGNTVIELGYPDPDVLPMSENALKRLEEAKVV